MIHYRMPVQGFLLVLAAALWLLANAALAANISIVSPQSEETVHNNSGNITVTVQADLRDRQRIRLLLDGSPAAPDGNGKTFALSGIDRGEHTLEAKLLNENGEVVDASGPLTFYMWQASKKFPTHKPRPK